MASTPWTWERIASILLAAVAALALTMAGLLGGLSGDSPKGRDVTVAFAGLALVGVGLVAFGKGRYAALAMGAALVGGLAYSIAQDLPAADTWWIWLLLAGAAGLALRVGK